MDPPDCVGFQSCRVLIMVSHSIHTELVRDIKEVVKDLMEVTVHPTSKG